MIKKYNFNSHVHDGGWHNFPDIRKTFNHVDMYKKCVIFDVSGNNYRIIAMVEFEKHIVFIRAVLLHSEYDRNKWKSRPANKPKELS